MNIRATDQSAHEDLPGAGREGIGYNPEVAQEISYSDPPFGSYAAGSSLHVTACVKDPLP